MKLWNQVKSWFGNNSSSEHNSKSLTSSSSSIVLRALAHSGFKERTHREVLNTYERNPDIRKVIDIIGSTCATSKFKVIGSDGEEDKEHELNSIFRRPNRFMSRTQFKSIITKYIDLLGECYVVRRDTIRGPELYPVPPTKVFWHKDSSKVADILLFGDKDQSGPREEIKNAIIGDNFVRIMRHSLKHPYTQSLGWGETLGAELDISEFAATHEATYLKNHAMKDMILNSPSLTKSKKDEFLEMWDRYNSGPENSGRPALMNLKEVEAIEISGQHDQEALIEQRKYSARVVREALGVPREVLGDNITSNKATANVADYQFKKNVCQPRADFLAEQIDSGVLQILSDRVDTEGIRIEAENIVPDDEEFVKELVQATPFVFTVNEVRELADKEPVEDGDVLIGDMEGDPVEMIMQETPERRTYKTKMPYSRLLNGSMAEGLDVLKAAKELE